MSTIEAIQLENIKNELDCVICSSILDDPHSLLCGHTFCGLCLMEWFKEKKACPVCKVPALRQPTPNFILQKLVAIIDPVREDGPATKLQRIDWLELFPAANQSSYIREEDADGVINRCSNCAWELDEQLFCSQCLIDYGDNSGNHATDSQDISDMDSRGEEEDDEELNDFVVGDGHVEYEERDSDAIHDDSDSEVQSIGSGDSGDIDNQHNTLQQDSSRWRKRRRTVVIPDEDDENNDSVVEISDEEDGNEEGENDDEEYGEEDDVEMEEVQHKRTRNRYVLESASESEVEEVQAKAHPSRKKEDSISTSISDAISRMETQATDAPSSASSATSDTDDESADYEAL